MTPLVEATGVITLLKLHPQLSFQTTHLSLQWNSPAFVAHLNTYPVLVIQHLDRKISVIIFFSIEEMWHHSTNVVWSAFILRGLQGNDAVD